MSGDPAWVARLNQVLLAAYEVVDAEERGDPSPPVVAVLKNRLQAYSGEG